MADFDKVDETATNFVIGGTPGKQGVVAYEEYAKLEPRLFELENRVPSVYADGTTDPNKPTRPHDKDPLFPEKDIPYPTYVAPPKAPQNNLPTQFPTFTAETKPVASSTKDNEMYAWTGEGADNTKEQVKWLVEKFKQFQVTKETRGLAYEDPCLYPNLKLSDGYKTLKFNLFDGSGDPMAHLRSYCDKLVGVGHNEKIRMQLFNRSMTSDALTWYSKHQSKKWTNWEAMAGDFVESFGHNIDVMPDQFYLEKLKKKPTETFREFVTR